MGKDDNIKWIDVGKTDKRTIKEENKKNMGILIAMLTSLQIY